MEVLTTKGNVLFVVYKTLVCFIEEDNKLKYACTGMKEIVKLIFYTCIIYFYSLDNYYHIYDNNEIWGRFYMHIYV